MHTNYQACRFSLLSILYVRWPRRMLPLMSQGEYADETDRQTDRLTDADRYITLSAMDVTSVTNKVHAIDTLSHEY